MERTIDKSVHNGIKYCVQYALSAKMSKYEQNRINNIKKGNKLQCASGKKK